MTAGTAGSGGPAARPVAFLPGPVPDRETLEGWTRWRLTRRDFGPAPVITAADHAAMTPRQRRLHDLHRVATHSDLAIQETPMSAFVSRAMRSRRSGARASIVRILCKRSASLMRTTRMSSTMARTILRTLSAWASSRDANSSLLILPCS